MMIEQQYTILLLKPDKPIALIQRGDDKVNLVPEKNTVLE